MSELSKLSQQVEALKLKLNAITSLQDQNIADVHHYNKVKAIHTDLQACKEQLANTLVPSVAKFVTKCESKDPVTGLFRYNSAAIAKINYLNDEINTMNVTCEDLSISYSSCIQKYSTQFDHENTNSDIAANSEGVFNIPSAAKHYQIDMQYLTASAILSTASASNDDSDANCASDNIQLEQNRRLADDLRKAKQKQIQELTLRLSDLQNALNEEVNRLNTKTRGILELPGVLTALRTDCETPVLRKLLQTVVQMLGQIIQHPDKDELRRLRLDHPALWDNLTSHPGGALLLLVVGFVLKAETNAPLSSIQQDTSNNSSSSNKTKSEAVSLRARCVEIATLGIEIATISSGGTRKSSNGPLLDDSATLNEIDNESESVDISKYRLRLVMFMIEPDTNNMSAWIAWFDGLQGMKQYLETEIGLLK